MLINIDITLYRWVITWNLASSYFPKSTIVHIRNDNMGISKVNNNSHMSISWIISSPFKLNYCSKSWCISSCMSHGTSVCNPLICISSPVYIFIWRNVPGTVSPRSRKWLSPNERISSLCINIFTDSLICKAMTSSIGSCRSTACYSSVGSTRLLRNWSWFWWLLYCTRNNKYISDFKISSTEKQILSYDIILRDFVLLSKSRDCFSRWYFMCESWRRKDSENLSRFYSVTCKLVFPTNGINTHPVIRSNSSKTFSTKHFMLYKIPWSSNIRFRAGKRSIYLKEWITRLYKCTAISDNISISKIRIYNGRFIDESSIKIILCSRICESSKNWINWEHKDWKTWDNSESYFSAVFPLFVKGLLKYTRVALYTSSNINFGSQNSILESKSLGRFY